jgi:ectoine hydroxylase-related dioxygenase (phytanoyl-CoA dioxygenase family)
VAPNDPGYVVLPHLFDDRAVAALRSHIETLLTRERADQADASGGTVYLPGLSDDPVVIEALAHPEIKQTVRRLLGAEPVLRDARYRSPKPGGGAQALHRDEPYPHGDGRWCSATVIIGLVEFSADNGPPRIVPGTHIDRIPFTARSVPFRHAAENLLTGPAGTAYVFCGAALHSGTRNVSSAQRPGIQATFVPGYRMVSSIAVRPYSSNDVDSAIGREI